MSDCCHAFDGSLDRALKEAIEAHSGVAKYSSKVNVNSYRGFVFLAPDWRVYEFYFSIQSYQDLILKTSNLEKANSVLVEGEIANINSLLQIPVNSVNPQLPVFSASNIKWQPVSNEKKIELSKAFSFRLKSDKTNRNLIFYSSPISFYRNACLIAFNTQSSTEKPKWHYFIEVESDDEKLQYYTLNGLSAPIHDCNLLLKLDLTVNDVLAYLSFFCFFIQSEQGSFYVIEHPYDTKVPKVMWDESFIHKGQKLDLLKHVRSPKIIAETDHEFVCEATIYNGSELSCCKMTIEKNGMIGMQESHKISQALPYILNIVLN